MAHSPFSPSSAYRWMKCPLSVKLAPLYPQTTSAAATEGTRQHDVAASCLVKKTDSEEPGVRTYIEIIRKMHESFGGDLLVEYKVTLVKDLCWGTLDAGVVAPSFLGVSDYKSGTKPVSATGNPQLQIYALGLLREFPMPRNAFISLAIVQPRTTSGWPVKRYTPSVETLLKFKGEVFRAIDAAQAPNPVGVAGDHCGYCPAKLHCPAYLKAHGAKRVKLI